MKIVLAPDSFKGSLTAAQVCKAMQNGVERVFPEATAAAVPMADGGEGTVQSLVDAVGGEIIPVPVTGPLGGEVTAFFGRLNDGKTAVIEMAAASGLPLVPAEQRDPRRATTRGTGELIRAALDRGCTHLLIGIGGSATNDGGAGMAQALGFRLLDADGVELPPGGAALNRLARIDPRGKDPRLERTEIVVACDVNNPLTGPDGATAVYGPQKGVTPDMVAELDRALDRFARVVRDEFGKDILSLPGAGAAGGLGGGLVALLGATLRPGVTMVIETVNLAEQLAAADLVLTGEGRIDGQTVYGKTPIGVAECAKTYGLPVLAVAGYIGQGVAAVYEEGIDGVMALPDRPLTLEDAMQNAAGLVADATERLLRIYRCGLLSRKN
jgi:glycerate kinase